MKEKIDPQGSKLLIMGFTFKEDCPDTRNTRVFNLVQELERYKIKVSIYDPIADFGGNGYTNH